MTRHSSKPATAYFADPDMLTVARPDANGRAELFVAMASDGKVFGFNGHVDLGTGIRTALAQIIAEELDVSFESVEMVLGTTTATPNQGATIASETIQVTAIPMRLAAATAKAHLLALAAGHLGCRMDELLVEDGVVRVDDGNNRFVHYGELIAGQGARLTIDPQAPLKPSGDYRLVGTARARVDIPEKATGAFSYVHDVRVPEMLHGRVVRPPYAGFDHGPHVGASLVGVDEQSVADIPGLVSVVAIGDFVGIVATREENAILAMQKLKVIWNEPPLIPDLNRPEEAIRSNPATPRKLADRGNIERALNGEGVMERTYIWPFQMHGSIGPSCAVADWRPDALTVWSGTQNPFPMRADLSRLLDMPEDLIVVERLEAAGCYGRNCADDVTADAALLSRAVGKPVRVQLTREQEHLWEPKGAGQVIDVRGGLDTEGGPAAYDFETRYPSNLAPTLPLLLTGKAAPVADVAQMGDRTAIPPYAFSNMRVTVHDMPPIARASWFRGVSAMPNSFAHESFIDELATAAGVDPIEYRLRYLHDPRAVDLVHAVAERAQWKPHTGPFTHGGDGDILYGRGFAYAVYVHGKFPGTAAAWAAWVADVAVNKKTGEIVVTKVTCGQDTGQAVNPDGVRHQIHGNVIQSTSRVLKEEVGFSAQAVLSKEWGAYPILQFPDVPEIDVLMVPRPDDPPLGAGESASVPSAAAIANAIFDATGVRFRELPLTPEKVRAALNPLPPAAESASTPPGRRRRVAGPLAGAFAGALALGAAVLPWRAPIAPVERPGPNVFSAATIERGRLAAAAGACNVCHVGNDGTPFAGGRALETPFGVVYATNITPDTDAGIGAWSYPAFERAMRQGVSRDGRHIYPAHPYTSFAKASDGDLQALYAYLMQQPASPVKTPETTLRFPYNLRPMMAGWNALYLSSSAAPKDPARGTEWNRGAELVEGLGHCSACHSDRNVFGAEVKGARHLGGGYADGWHAPALTSLSQSPVEWTADSFYEYLRKGRTADHGAAAGPMGHVVEALAPLPDADIRAMATYLASLNKTNPEPQAQRQQTLDASARADQTARITHPVGARLFEGACAACHNDKTPIAPLAFNTNLHSERPDNLIQTILHGIPEPVGEREEVMAMPAFGEALSKQAIEDLAAYMRARFAPDKPQWQNVGERVRTLGTGPAH